VPPGRAASNKVAPHKPAPSRPSPSTAKPPPARPAPRKRADRGPASQIGLLSPRRASETHRRREGYTEERFLSHQRAALDTERATYQEQARNLRAEAESLVEEMEPGDIQFDDESGEGGTVTVDRERDLALSAQAMIAVEEIDHALAKMAGKSYGVCENCGRLIPKARLEALPFARLCIDCKSGGLSRR
ncbi:MAG: TraR/DksA family transcriptional regulator, partial [Acidimicrobiales bacterium]